MDTIFILIIYFVALNILTFFMMGRDKIKARKNLWRTPEGTFFVLSIIGGTIGTIFGMYLFRHKTRKWYFRFGLPLILIIQVVIIFLIKLAPIEFIFI